MVIIYLGIGVYFLSADANGINFNPHLFRLFGIFALLYGLFRVIRIYQDYKSENYEKFDNKKQY
jgi:hypothetical protein